MPLRSWRLTVPVRGHRRSRGLSAGAPRRPRSAGPEQNDPQPSSTSREAGAGRGNRSKPSERARARAPGEPSSRIEQEVGLAGVRRNWQTRWRPLSPPQMLDHDLHTVLALARWGRSWSSGDRDPQPPERSCPLTQSPVLDRTSRWGRATAPRVGLSEETDATCDRRERGDRTGGGGHRLSGTSRSGGSIRNA